MDPQVREYLTTCHSILAKFPSEKTKQSSEVVMQKAFIEIKNKYSPFLLDCDFEWAFMFQNKLQNLSCERKTTFHNLNIKCWQFVNCNYQLCTCLQSIENAKLFQVDCFIVWCLDCQCMICCMCWPVFSSSASPSSVLCMQATISISSILSDISTVTVSESEFYYRTIPFTLPLAHICVAGCSKNV